MGIGIGIFLGLVFLGTIYLYTQTRETWNWRRIWKRGGIVLAILIALPFIVAGLAIAYDMITNYVDNIPKKVTTLQGLTLGEKLSDVEFKLPLKKDKTQYNSDTMISYSVEGQPFRDLAFDKNNRLISIGETCTNDFNVTPSFERVNGIPCNASAELILEKYGKNKVRIQCPSKKQIAEEKDFNVSRIRAYDAVDYGVRYILNGNQMFSLNITTPEELKGWTGVNWVPCDEAQKIGAEKK